MNDVSVGASKSGKTKMALGLLGVVIVGLIAFRLYLPTLILNKTNAVLAKIPGYYGHIDGSISICGAALIQSRG